MEEKTIVEQTEQEESAQVLSENNEIEENLSEDELYAKIQTEKLLKRKKTKKITTLVSLCVAFVLAVIVIIMAAVPVSLKPNCLKEGFSYVTMYAGSAKPDQGFGPNDEKFAKFMQKYDKAFSQTYLTALFSGSLFQYKIEENGDNLNPGQVLGSLGSLIGTDTYFVRLRYAQEKVFTMQNGKAYISNYGPTSNWNGELTFSEAYVVVNKTAGVQDTKVYIEVKRPSSSSSAVDGEVSSLVSVTVRADTHVIYEAWQDLTEN